MLSVVRFQASWCGPCQALKPTMDNIQESLKDNTVFTDIDIDKDPMMRQIHHITSIPTIMVFKDGTEVGRRQGGGTQTELEDWINSYRDKMVSIEPIAGPPGAASIVLNDIVAEEEPVEQKAIAEKL